MPPVPIFEFGPTSVSSRWTVVDDGVMGGVSSGKFHLNSQGHGVFKGRISLENNGGFSSLRYQPGHISTASHTKIVLMVKGDGKRYRFSIKHKLSDAHAYISYFNTTGDWQRIEIPLATLYPSFRGRRLEGANYCGDGIAEVAFLIGNKKAEEFQLEIATLVLE